MSTPPPKRPPQSHIEAGIGPGDDVTTTPVPDEPKAVDGPAPAKVSDGKIALGYRVDRGLKKRYDGFADFIGEKADDRVARLLAKDLEDNAPGKGKSVATG